MIRRRRWSRARTPQLRAEAAWDDLRDRLSDLGVVWARSWTPRALMHRLSHDHTLPAEALAALERLVHDIETARYAPPDAASARTTDQVRADTDRVVEAVGELVGPQARRRARLVPASGIAVFTGSRRALRQQSTGEQEGGLLRVQPRRPRDRRPRERAGSGDRR